MGKGDAGKLLQWHMGALSVVELIIKKDRPIVIDNEIGRIFRQHNIVEYKSKEDALNMGTLLKVEAYACLY